MICEHCKSEFIKKVDHQKFCSPECANRNNVKRWREKNKKICQECGSIKDNRSIRCRDCNLKLLGKDIVDKNITIKEYQKRESVTNKHPSWKNAHIRNFARSWNKHLKNHPCQNCGYSKHIEFCHIKPICDFDISETIGSVNSEDNILILCRNCHWEFDNGLLNINNINKRIYKCPHPGSNGEPKV